MKKSLLSYSGILLLGAMLLLVNGVADRLFGGWSLDLTEEGLYSLSAGSRSILAQVDQPITLKYYFSKTDSGQFPAMKLYGDRIYDLLREYERRGKGKISFEIYDPRPDSEDEEWAQKYGLAAIPTREGPELYMGVVGVNGAGEERAIPVFNIARQEFLEYDITKLIHTLTRPKKPTIGILSSVDLLGGGASPYSMPNDEAKWFLTGLLEEQAEAKYLDAEAKTIDSGLDLLLVIHPKGLSPEIQYAVDQFVMGGGRLMVFVDPYFQGDETGGDPNNPLGSALADRSSDFNAVLSKWGVELMGKKVAADLTLAARVDTGRGDGPKRFVPWIHVQRDVLNSSDMATSKLEQLILPWPGALKRVTVPGIEVTSLFHTTGDSQLLEEMDVKFGGGDPDKLLRSFSRSGEELMLAAHITGKLKSAFAGPPAQKESEKKEGGPSHLAETKDVAHVVVVADVDFLTNRFSVASQNIFGTRLYALVNDNLNFVQNAVENLLGSNELISVRSRGRFSREFTRVRALEANAQQHWQQEEALLQAKLNNANQRLSQLQTGPGGSKQVVTGAMLEEIRKFREEKREAQRRLREVRRHLREDIERLGNRLFLVNAFFVPLLLAFGAIGYQTLRR